MISLWVRVGEEFMRMLERRSWWGSFYEMVDADHFSSAEELGIKGAF